MMCELLTSIRELHIQSCQSLMQHSCEFDLFRTKMDVYWSNSVWASIKGYSNRNIDQAVDCFFGSALLR